jgi:hypothetical protein
MSYRILADAAMAVHFGFLAYVVAGGFLAWRWPRAIWPHLPLAGWGLITVVFHLGCPLTRLEDWARRRAARRRRCRGVLARRVDPPAALRRRHRR